MLQNERIDDNQEALRTALEGYASRIWIALPGIVTSYSAAKGTCHVQPAIKGETLSTKGESQFVDLPLLVDVPVIFQGGGGFVTTFPIKPGDEALVIFSSRCIDGWWQNGGTQVAVSSRIHSIRDGFALIGPRSQVNLIPNVSTTTAQLRSLDGSTYLELAPGGVVNIVAPGGVNIQGDINVAGLVSTTEGFART